MNYAEYICILILVAALKIEIKKSWKLEQEAKAAMSRAK